MQVGDGETVKFMARPAGRNALLMLIESIVGRDRWIVLEVER